jgi:hypothetical protein
LLLYFSVIERWRYLRLSPTLATERMVRKLYRQARPLAGERTRAETAYEFKQKLVDQINTIARNSMIKRLLLSSQNDIELLTDLYQATLFRQNNIQKNDVRKALKAWKHLRLRLLIARMNAYFTKVILSGLKNLYQRVMSLRAFFAIAKHPERKQPSVFKQN